MNAYLSQACNASVAKDGHETNGICLQERLGGGLGEEETYEVYMKSLK